MTKGQRNLVTGATGYIGGRLVPRLLEADYPVCVLVRNPDRLRGRSWLEQVEVVQGDVLEPGTLPAAMEDIDVAYYFVHSLYVGSRFHELDMTAARNFASAAQAAGVQRIIYLGGLGDPTDRLSPHLSSRQQTGATLRETGVPVTEFRAAIIIGSGSGSFEMIRYLTERIPLMICPRWVFSRIQPIAIRDVLDYLVAALETPESAEQIIEIGGRDVMTYGDTMMVYAQIRGLRRVVLPVPVLTPSLSSHWVGWVTPVPARLARPLIEGLRNDVVVRDDKARRLFPQLQLMDYETAVRLALSDLSPEGVDLVWIDAQAAAQDDPPTEVDIIREGMFIKRQYRAVHAPSEAVYTTFTCLGGQRGWLYANWLWRLRGFVDRLLTGGGSRCRRRHPREVEVGDKIDFFQVEAVEPGKLIRLRSKLKMPGQLWLQFEAQPLPGEETRLIQTIFFAPRGFLGLIYWYVSLPLHRLVFSGLIRELDAACTSC